VGPGDDPGQAWLKDIGLQSTPVVNVDNACASAATAMHVGCLAVQGGTSAFALHRQWERTLQEAGWTEAVLARGVTEGAAHLRRHAGEVPEGLPPPFTAAASTSSAASPAWEHRPAMSNRMDSPFILSPTNGTTLLNAQVNSPPR
jgi:acetyl-CoA acetyltransferase